MTTTPEWTIFGTPLSKCSVELLREELAAGRSLLADGVKFRAQHKLMAIEAELCRRDAPLPKEGTLRIWWIPQIGIRNQFHVPVTDTMQARLIYDTLAQYDIFQFDNKIKPDYCNTGGLEIFEDGEWVEWCDPETGENIDEVMRAERMEVES